MRISISQHGVVSISQHGVVLKEVILGKVQQRNRLGERMVDSSAQRVDQGILRIQTKDEINVHSSCTSKLPVNLPCSPKISFIFYPRA